MPVQRETRLARLSSTIVWLFDAISIEFLDRLPNALTVSAIVFLFSASQVATIFALRSWNGIENAAVTIAAIMISSICVGVPIVGFGQMQYRRARLAYSNSLQLSEQLILARDEAQAANAEKSRFLASMSHELRTPLNAIIGFSEILKCEYFGPIGVGRYRDYANDIYRSGHHLLSLINDVLDLSKIESGRGNIRKDSEVDLNQIIAEVCELMSVTSQKGGVFLSASLPEARIRVWADERMLRQILLNLISNAIKFTPENGRVIARLSLQVEGAMVEIVNSGIGMTPQEQEIALQPFGQIDSFQARKHKGTGLGLPLVNAMVDLHGGNMTIRSTSGEGTMVAFSIPAERVLEDNPRSILPRESEQAANDEIGAVLSAAVR